MEKKSVKSFLHESIENIHDEDFLMEIKNLVELQYNPASEFKLSYSQKKRLEQSLNQLKKEEIVSNEQADELVEKWLKK
jgi:hypothetical protein